MTSIGSGMGIAVLPDVFCYTNQIVNLTLVGNENEFVLVDAGMPKSADEISEMIAELFGEQVKAFPQDGSIPHMQGWKWIHIPGHTSGHVSLFREADRALIAGDAFVTVKQESLYKVLTQTQEISGPPLYYTTDWKAAYQSVKILEALKPEVAVTGHGLPMNGKELRENLSYFTANFKEIATPKNCRYTN
ncbi:MBL fold metallo-hydrolase [Neobacillus drentensis]|uniref:MBL fold metallo-hydrolase n=1 Tax=Neobacillus drentensis TaxID=220684 RepID=UPI002FFF0ED6